MMKQAADPGFFVGYFKSIPDGLRGFLLVVAAAILGVLLGLGHVLGTAQSDPGEGRPVDRGQFLGVLEAHPYPMLRMLPDARHPDGRALLLSGQGKRGVVQMAGALDGKLVDAGGGLLRRGDIRMLQVGGQIRLREAEDPPAEALGYQPAPPVLLGRWRLTGELCDGKCYLGAMRPGTGLAHKACANLCIQGGVPPVFVSNAEVRGHSFFVVSDADGNPLPDEIYDVVALLVDVEGEVELIDDIARFKMDLSTVKVR